MSDTKVTKKLINDKIKVLKDFGINTDSKVHAQLEACTTTYQLDRVCKKLINDWLGD